MLGEVNFFTRNLNLKKNFFGGEGGGREVGGGGGRIGSLE